MINSPFLSVSWSCAAGECDKGLKAEGKHDPVPQQRARRVPTEEFGASADGPVVARTFSLLAARNEDARQNARRCAPVSAVCWRPPPSSVRPQPSLCPSGMQTGRPQEGRCVYLVGRRLVSACDVLTAPGETEPTVRIMMHLLIVYLKSILNHSDHPSPVQLSYIVQ